ncbi:hypothetical protein [Streptomyces sp. NPDC048636]|uniref:hypothetical protein n=1 Tax=Streptomyces sp. NPDC048636 TaxID=3155762 RepID=UPI00342C879E
MDGSGWQGVYEILKRDGYNVSIVQNPTLPLARDVAAVRIALDVHDGCHHGHAGRRQFDYIPGSGSAGS